MSTSAAKKRMPADAANELLAAAGDLDPQRSFSDVFGGGSVRPEATPPKPPAPAGKGAPETENRPPAPKPEGKKPTDVRRPLTGKKKDSLEEGWSRKTYRLRPDQYMTLAKLSALRMSESGRFVTVSELAREAFDHLFSKHAKLLARLDDGDSPEANPAA